MCAGQIPGAPGAFGQAYPSAPGRKKIREIRGKELTKKRGGNMIKKTLLPTIKIC